MHICLIDPLQPEGLEETESERPSFTEDLRKSADLSLLANPFEEAGRPIQSSEEDPNDEDKSGKSTHKSTFSFSQVKTSEDEQNACCKTDQSIKFELVVKPVKSKPSC